MYINKMHSHFIEELIFFFNNSCEGNSSTYTRDVGTIFRSFYPKTEYDSWAD